MAAKLGFNPNSNWNFCALAYRFDKQASGALSPDLQVVVLVVRDAKGDLDFLVSPNLQQIVQRDDLQYVNDFLLEFLERARRYPDTLFLQLSSLTVGPLVTHKVGLTGVDDEYLISYCAEFVDLQDLFPLKRKDERLQQLALLNPALRSTAEAERLLRELQVRQSELMEHNEALRVEKMDSIVRLAAGLAHEINNPLEGLANSLYLARINSNDPEAVCGYLDLADNELKRIAHLTRQTLGLYRDASAPMAVSVAAMLDSAIDLFKDRIIAASVNLIREYEGDLTVKTIPGELLQVFGNLLSNSLDALAAGGSIRLRVAKSTCRKSGQPGFRVTVADTGEGIEPGILPRIFEPLFTTKAATGTGLGLWVAKEIVEKHGGTIHVRSRRTEPNRGTVFSIVLPNEIQAASARSLSPLQMDVHAPIPIEAMNSLALKPIESVLIQGTKLKPPAPSA